MLHVQKVPTSIYHLLVGCDANVRKTAWGITNIDLIGESMVINCKQTRISPGDEKVVLDMKHSSLKVSEKISKWDVSDEPPCSDLRQISPR